MRIFFLCFYSNIPAIVAVNLLPLAANADSPAPRIQPQASNGRQQSSNTKNRLFEHHKHKRNLCIATHYSLKTTLIIRSHTNPSRNRDGGVRFLLFLQSKHFKYSHFIFWHSTQDPDHHLCPFPMQRIIWELRMWCTSPFVDVEGFYLDWYKRTLMRTYKETLVSRINQKTWQFSSSQVNKWGFQHTATILQNKLGLMYQTIRSRP